MAGLKEKNPKAEWNKLQKYMEENKISLEPETTEQTQGNGQTQLSGELEDEDTVKTPSITEQNLNNADTITPESEPVPVENLPTQQPPAEEQAN